MLVCFVDDDEQPFSPPPVSGFPADCTIKDSLTVILPMHVLNRALFPDPQKQIFPNRHFHKTKNVINTLQFNLLNSLLINRVLRAVL